MVSDEKKYESRVYHLENSAVFKKTTEKWGGLSNMASGFPLFVSGISIRSSEALYQACRYPHLPSVQEKIISQTSPMTAKMVGKPFRDQTRDDWLQTRVIIMKWCLRVKLIQNFEKFSDILKRTGDLQIVENSNKDDFWGAKPTDINTFVGINALGRLLMELREQLDNGNTDDFISILPPKIDNFLICGHPIEIVKREDNLRISKQLGMLDFD